ncbi:Shr3 amino acid permease chaperone [Nadsonia fulvescens var. elongata DSM 6958]|uniref:Shr3 amino acid permease chaperone n=1 Tax=Nadsonia fulvescens var. elongata DSM 6958 TaxID=857566 RepID=A0A1E3PKY5_9ASCO|nr:Shr3 amino acid permease chaperone [Nadsonia fulvescens var. elongata DSM 6958]
MPTSASSFASGLILVATSFGLGALYSSWPYDFYTLWTTNPTPESFALSLRHYQQWAELPMYLYHVMHTVIFIGLVGFIVKLYKPSESNKLFDGGSLFLYMIGVAIYLTNLRRGVQSAVAGTWGEVDEATGINVIAASQVMIVFVLLGVLGLQLGQFWAEHEDSVNLKKYREAEAEAEAEASKGASKPKKDSKKNK